MMFLFKHRPFTFELRSYNFILKISEFHYWLRRKSMNAVQLFGKSTLHAHTLVRNLISILIMLQRFLDYASCEKPQSFCKQKSKPQTGECWQENDCSQLERLSF